MSKPITVIHKRTPEGGQEVRMVQEWWWDFVFMGSLCIIYILFGEIDWELPGLAMVILLGFWGTGGVQDSLLFHRHPRKITRIKKVFGIPFSTVHYHGDEPAFLILGTMGNYGGRGGFWWTYRPVLILRNGTSIPFSRGIKEPERMQQALIKVAHHLEVPVRIASTDEEFLPPREGFADMKTPLPTRIREEAENFHQSRYMGQMKRMMLLALAIGTMAAIFLTQL